VRLIGLPVRGARLYADRGEAVWGEAVVLMADVDLEIVLSADGLNPYRFALAMYGL
jgi:hypothetical protein